MTAFFYARKVLIRSFLVVVGAFLMLAAPGSLSGMHTEARAEGSRSGVVLGNRGFGRSFGTLSSSDLLQRERRRSINARNARIARERLARRGVVIGSGGNAFGNTNLRFFPRSRGSVSSSGPVAGQAVTNRRNQQRRISSRDLLNSDRRAAIEARNNRISDERVIRRAQNSAGAGVIVSGGNRQGVISSGFGGGVAGTTFTQRTPCPRSHNCGYRIYDNGTGPRIITRGVPAGGDLPAFDGLAGPQVITLD